jgi:hypothetical protein
MICSGVNRFLLPLQAQKVQGFKSTPGRGHYYFVPIFSKSLAIPFIFSENRQDPTSSGSGVNLYSSRVELIARLLARTFSLSSGWQKVLVCPGYEKFLGG